MKSPAEILAERSPAWRELLTGKPRIGTCDVCEAQNVELRLHVGFMGLQTYHCGCSERAALSSTNCTRGTHD